MSASADMKLSESIRGRSEDFLEAKCLVGDICTRNRKKKKKKKTGAQTQKYGTNLIRFKLVQT